jgi:DNA polymerase-3 subunit epsilon
MRQVLLDTETTGLDWRNGHRVIEIGCVEMINRSLTGRHYHVYLNPQREIDVEAEAVHGISLDFLADKPKFSDIACEFEEFVRGAELVIHNAPFDVGFLDHELSRLGRQKLAGICAGVIDTLRMAKEQNPGKKASLDALCDRYEIDNGRRTLHGALLDAEILAEVYLAMTRGQESLIIGLDDAGPAHGGDSTVLLAERPPLKILRASNAEIESHQRVLAEVTKASGGRCLWAPADRS